MATQKQNDLMNKLIRANAPETASTPKDHKGSETNAWLRSSVQAERDEKFSTLWARLMGAHLKELEWEERLKGGDNGNA